MPRIAKTETEKTLNGSHKRPNRTVMQIDGNLPAEPPVGLKKEAQAAWIMAVKCAPKGVLSAVDHSVLERWARNYALYREIARAVETGGVEGEDGKSSGMFNALIKIQAILAACERELGFTPASRARVRVETKEEEKNDFDAF